jgi:hypothetical protein
VRLVPLVRFRGPPEKAVSCPVTAKPARITRQAMTLLSRGRNTGRGQVRTRSDRPHTRCFGSIKGIG